MKKYFLFACVAAALVSCSSDEFLGENPELTQKVENDGAILFKAFTGKASRAIGADAAELLGSNFVVEGIKGDGVVANQVEVFDHYNVNYAASTANTTESNTNDWEYVGQTKHTLSAASAQTIKYWDYAAKQYDFVAFSYGQGVGATPTYSELSEIKYANLGKAVDASGNANAVYTVTGSAEELAASYIADLVTVYNRNNVSEFGNTVITPKFRSLGTKVRLAFYETVPGYSVKNLKFYNAAWDGTTATTAAGLTTPTLFAANAIFPSATSKGTMNVYYPTVGWTNKANADYNQAHVTFTAGSESGDALVTTKTFGNLANMAAAEGSETAGNIYLGRTSETATYAGDKTAADKAYQVVLPLGTKDNLQLRVEYDLVPIDGAAEVIHVRDARAVVPAAYADWKPNYAYTYIFKISDNTNGWTGVDGDGNVVEGLTPITFDAEVVESTDGAQETITTVATPSVTSYQLGTIVTANNEYVAGDIYVAVEGNVALSAANAHLYVVTAGTATEQTAALAVEQGKSDPSTDDFDKTDVKLTQVYPVAGDYVTAVPALDGNTLAVNALRIGATAGTTYVFEYIASDGKKAYKVIKVKADPTPSNRR